jgi:NitT/TauT family transport system substrate-binding protein
LKPHRLAGLVAIAFGLALTAAAPARAADTVRVAEVPFISSGGFLIAREKGYFRKVGIEIVTRIFDDGALAIPAMVAGEIDVSTMPASAGLFNSVAKGAPLVVFLDRGRDSKERSYTSISVTNELAEAGVRSPADFAKLKGKRIGIAATGSINQYSMALGLEKAGLNPATDVTWVSGIGQPDLMKMVGQKTVDVAAISYPFSMFAQNNKLARTVATGGDIDPDQQVTTYAAHKDFVATKRDVLVRFAMAYLRGVQDFNAAAADPKTHEAEVKILAANTSINKPELVTAMAPHWSWLSPDGMPNVDSIMTMQDFWAAGRFNLVRTKVAKAQLFDLTIARDAVARMQKDKPFD